MTTTEMGASKTRLLEATIAYLAEDGLADTSLRSIAGAIGTSHRMLSYHFGSREGLLAEVSRAVESQQRAAFEELVSDPEKAPLEVMQEMYRRLVDPALGDQERLFFELYARALQGDGEETGFFPEVVEAWVEPVSELFKRLGFKGNAARSEARLALAVSRGLLLDLLATNDRKAVHAAMTRYLARYDS